jgi:hypothetical protein
MYTNKPYASNIRIRLSCALALALAVIATGCNRDSDHTPTVQIHADAAQYVSRFVTEAAAHGRNVVISDLILEFGSVDGAPGDANSGARGVCNIAYGQTPVITLSRDAWDRSSDAEREELVFHELGHCILGLTHVGGINADGIPASVMNPTEIHGAIYKQFRAYYMKGLFGSK